MTEQVENQPVREVTSDSIKTRVEQFFAGADLTKNGLSTYGLIDVDVLIDGPEHFIEASVNGKRVAGIYKGPDPEDVEYTLWGTIQDPQLGEDAEIALIATYGMYKDGFSQVTCLEENLDDNHRGTLVEVHDQGRTIDIALTLGLEV